MSQSKVNVKGLNHCVDTVDTTLINQLIATLYKQWCKEDKFSSDCI